MKRIALPLALISALAVTSPASASKTVLVKDSYFSPKSLTVAKNTTLKFVWKGDLVHNVASGGKILISNRRKGSGTVKVKRSATYVCTLHSAMKMRVKVR